MYPPGGVGYDMTSFAPGDNFLGFRFADGGGQLHYGWAVINFDTTNRLVTIREWTYESTADVPVTVGVTAASTVPEPSSLMLLALGAAGLLAYRARRIALMQAESAA